MKRRQLLGALAPGLAWALAGCRNAPQQPLAEVPGLPSGMGRLYVYRPKDFYDAAVWTAIALNGSVVGNSAPGTVFYRDVAPGRYRISARSDELYPDQAKTVLVPAGASVFARVTTIPNYGKSSEQWQGNTFAIQIIAPGVAQRQINYLTLTAG